MKLLETALQYHQDGLQLIPLKEKEKISICKWKALIQQPESLDYVRNTFSNENYNIGIACGMVSKNLFIPDYDSKRTFDTHYKKYPLLKNIIDNTPITETKRGYHLYMRYNKPLKSKSVKNIDLQANGKYVVAPPSLHPSGQLYLFQDGWKKIYNINDDEFNCLKEFLPLQLCNEIQSIPEINIDTTISQDYQYQENTFGLGLRLFDYLLYGNLNGFNSRSEAEYSIVLKCISNGWSYPEIKHLLYRYAYINAKFRNKNEDWLYTQYYIKAYEWQNNNNSPIRATINNLTVNINSFTGRTRYTDRAIYLSILQIAREKNCLYNIDITIRQLQLKNNMHRKTIINSLKRLVDYNFISKQGINEIYHNRKYSLNNIVMNEGIACNIYDMAKTNNQDIYSHGGLNKTGKPIITALNNTFNKPYPNNFITIKQIANITNINYFTVNRILNKLEKYELINKKKVFKTYFYYLNELITDKTLHDIAFKLGVMGRYNKRKYLIQQERKVFKELS